MKVTLLRGHTLLRVSDTQLRVSHTAEGDTAEVVTLLRGHTLLWVSHTAEDVTAERVTQC